VRRRYWGRYAPTPFVGAAVLLFVLILLTPVLISSGQPAPGVLTQAELIVDRVAGSSVTHFYVRALGSTVRYAGIWVGVDENFSWSAAGSPPWSSLNWTTWWNSSEVVSFGFALYGNPVAVNITAFYESPGGTATYIGVLAFFVGTGSSGGPDLFAASSTSGIAVPSSTSIDNSSLPLPILLVQGSSGSLP